MDRSTWFELQHLLTLIIRRNQDMLVSPSLSKLLRVALFFVSLGTLHDLAHADPPYPICGNINITSTGMFQSNLDHLLLSFQSNSSTSKFQNTTVGNYPDTLYGLFLCYNFVSNHDCEICSIAASRDVQKLCQNRNEATVYEERCQLRYSSQSFFSTLSDTRSIPLANVNNISKPDQFRDVVNETLNNLSKIAAFNPSAGMYANGSVAFAPTGDTIHAFLQCTPDLSPDSCSTCLVRAITEILDIYYFSIGARLLSSSCYLRYELYDFYDVAAGSPGSAPTPDGTLPSTPNPGKLRNKWLIAIVAIGSATVLLALLIYCFATRNQTMKGESQISSLEIQSYEIGEHNTIGLPSQKFEGTDSLYPPEVPFFDMKTLNAATRNFSNLNKLGEGGFGPVYKGILSDGKEVAVKRLSTISEQGSEEFINEVLLILRLQHKNLVKLLGFCTYGEEKLLIYEYMPNSSLDSFLIDPRKRAQLNWNRRLNIISGVARGILYLHQDSRLRIIHRDLKPSNVLLDKDMNPKISDFGTARIFAGNDGEANTAKIAGTYGYMAPEFAMEGLYSIKSDVFSFGVLLIEIITGRRNFEAHLSKRTPNLVAHAWQLWNEGKVGELMDPLLGDSCLADEFLRCIHIGLLCVQEDPSERPSIPAVVLMLKCETATLSQPQRPAFSIGRFTDQHQTCYNNLSINQVTVSDVLPR